MDINSFILGLTTGKNAASGESGGGTDGWLYAGGTIAPTAAKHTVTHNFGKLPDIIAITFNTVGVIVPNEDESLENNSFAITGFVLSESLVGGIREGQTFGNTMVYNPKSGMHLIGTYTRGIEAIGTDWVISKADANTITFGGYIAKLAHHNNYGYNWLAYARK